MIYTQIIAKGFAVLFAALSFTASMIQPAHGDPSKKPEYTVRHTAAPPPLDASWDHPSWAPAETLTLQHWHERSSDHQPRTQARVLYDDAALYVMFRVDDRYVKATRTEYQDFVANDSCVEFFVQPEGGPGYFNFEMNCIGTLLLYYIVDPTVIDGDFADYERVSTDLGSTVKRHTSLSGPLTEEITKPVTWTVAYAIPWELFDNYVEAPKPLSGTTWRANFYKCADEASRPHWGSWAPIGPTLSFHQPSRFGVLRFE